MTTNDESHVGGEHVGLSHPAHLTCFPVHVLHYKPALKILCILISFLSLLRILHLHFCFTSPNLCIKQEGKERWRRAYLRPITSRQSMSAWLIWPILHVFLYVTYITNQCWRSCLSLSFLSLLGMLYSCILDSPVPACASNKRAGKCDNVRIKDQSQVGRACRAVSSSGSSDMYSCACSAWQFTKQCYWRSCVSLDIYLDPCTV